MHNSGNKAKRQKKKKPEEKIGERKKREKG